MKIITVFKRQGLPQLSRVIHDWRPAAPKSVRAAGTSCSGAAVKTADAAASAGRITGAERPIHKICVRTTARFGAEARVPDACAVRGELLTKHVKANVRGRCS